MPLSPQMVENSIQTKEMIGCTKCKLLIASLKTPPHLSGWWALHRIDDQTELLQLEGSVRIKSVIFSGKLSKITDNPARIYEMSFNRDWNSQQSSLKKCIWKPFVPGGGMRGELCEEVLHPVRQDGPERDGQHLPHPPRQGLRHRRRGGGTGLLPLRRNSTTFSDLQHRTQYPISSTQYPVPSTQYWIVAA